MQRSRDLRREVGNVENMRKFSVQLPDRAAGWVDQAAGRKGKTAVRFLSEMITETAEEDTESLDARLSRLNGLIGQMSVLAREIYARREEAQDR